MYVHCTCGKVTALGVLCCFSLCLTLLLSFFLLISQKHVCMCVYVYVYVCVYVCVCVCVCMCVDDQPPAGEQGADQHNEENETRTQE